VTRVELLAWLGTRRPTPPADLRAHLEAAMTDGAEPLPQHLARLGGELLARVARQPAGGRELALDLLAADALVTYAFEAQTEADVDGLGRLAQDVTGGKA
jgi:hypothetical protein